MQAFRQLMPCGLALALALLSSACSSATESPPPGEPETAASPTLPEQPAAAPVDNTPLPAVPLTPSPSCGAPGERVVLRLDWTADKRVPACVRPDDFEVRFGSKKARVTNLGPTSDGYCALDVLVPEKAETGAAVKVTMGRDVFQSTSSFAVPCQ